MTDKKIRIANLKAHIKNINETVYPDGYDEPKILMLNALRDRVTLLEQHDTNAWCSLVVSEKWIFCDTG